VEKAEHLLITQVVAAVDRAVAVVMLSKIIVAALKAGPVGMVLEE
jgi:hypothetical protein